MENESQFQEYVLKNKNGIVIKCTNYGAIISAIEVPLPDGSMVNIVEGFNTPLEYFKSNPTYFGAMVGRVAGRISKGCFELEGKKYFLRNNEKGKTHLHGGLIGFDKVFWTKSLKTDMDKGTLVLEYESQDMEEGYPGKLNVEVHYILNDENEFQINTYAFTDKPTLVSLTNHSYFNLNGDCSGDIWNHKLCLKSKEMVEVDQDLLATGKIVNIEGTAYDFTKTKTFKEALSSNDERIIKIGGIDNTFLLDQNEKTKIMLEGDKTGIKLEVETDQPVVVIYTCNSGDIPGRNGFIYKKHSATCLETESETYLINTKDQGKVQLNPYKVYNQKNKFRIIPPVK